MEIIGIILAVVTEWARAIVLDISGRRTEEFIGRKMKELRRRRSNRKRVKRPRIRRPR